MMKASRHVVRMCPTCSAMVIVKNGRFVRHASVGMRGNRYCLDSERRIDAARDH